MAGKLSRSNYDCFRMPSTRNDLILYVRGVHQIHRNIKIREEEPRKTEHLFEKPLSEGYEGREEDTLDPSMKWPSPSPEL